MSLSVASGSKADWLKLKEELKKAAPGLGIDKIGITTADPFLELKKYFDTA